MVKEGRRSMSASEKPSKGCEVFVGGLSRSISENAIRELFISCGEIQEIRLLKDYNGISKGYCFVRFATKDAASRATKEKNGVKLQGRTIVVAPSADQSSLFFGNLKKDWTSEEFEKMVGQAFEGVVSVDLAVPLPSVHSAHKKQQQNRGFAFVHFSSHAAAARALRVCSKSDFSFGGDSHPIVDWAEKEAELDPEEMAKVKIAYVGNLPSNVDEEFLRRLFEAYGELERVAVSWKASTPIGFVHFSSRSDLDRAIKDLDGRYVQGPGRSPKFKLQVSVARSVTKNEKRGRHESHEKPDHTGKSRYGSSDRRPKAPRLESPDLIPTAVDAYEEIILSLPSGVTERLLRIFRLGIATRFDVDIQCLTSLRELPEIKAITVLDEFLSSGPVGHAKGAYLASLVAKHQGLRTVSSQDIYSLRKSVDFPASSGDFGKRERSCLTPGYEPLISRTAGTASVRYEASIFDGNAASLSSVRTYPKSSYAALMETSAHSYREPSRSYDIDIRSDPRPSSKADQRPRSYDADIRSDPRPVTKADEKPIFRFDPYTGEPYKFDPFTGERIHSESFSGHSTRRY